MIVNSYAILALFVASLQLMMAIGLLGTLWRTRSAWAGPAGTETADRQLYLLMSLSLLVLMLGVAGWPLLYLLLQSYIPSWEGVMCIYGVTKIGTGSLGSSRFLPDLVGILQLSKPLLVFAGGVWFVLYLANRVTATGPLLRRLLLGQFVLGSLHFVDAVVMCGYVLIPKSEQHLAVGCCTSPGRELVDVANQPLLDPVLGRGLIPVFLLWVGVMVLGLLVGAIRGWTGRAWVTVLSISAAGLVFVGWVVLVDKLSPFLLQRPHHCPYDLLGEVPASVVGIGMFAVGCMCMGWAAGLSWLGDTPETRTEVPDLVSRILFCGLFSYLGSITLFSVECSLI